jgi:FdhE protein
MTQVGTLQHDPIPIGEIAKPPFAKLPNPAAMFARRAERLKSLAAAHELDSYLVFLADLSEAQHRIQDGLPNPDANAAARARQFGMPPLDRPRFTRAAFDAAWECFVAFTDGISMPESARLAVLRVKACYPAAEAAMIGAVLADAIPVEALAEHVFVAAMLQVHFARLAAQLDVEALVPIGEGADPACGAPPVASIVVGWNGAFATRFCACSLCGTLWNRPRVRCTLCGATQGIAYQEIAGGPAIVKAETCEFCRGYVKILHQHSESSLDPVADDVTALALDMLLRDSEYRRGTVNPFLLGY